MKLADKILNLRKKQGMSQETMAEKLKVSRQAVSRWEMGSAQPDASNILQLSKLFGVTTDYLLNDDYESDCDVPVVKEAESAARSELNRQTAFVFLTGLNVMIFIYQLIACFIIQNDIFVVLGIMLSVAVVTGFEFGYRKNKPKSDNAEKYRLKFYSAAVWLGAYFPVRILTDKLMLFYPRPYSGAVFEIIALVAYLLFSIFAVKLIEKKLH